MKEDGWNTPRQLIFSLDFFGLKKQSLLENIKFKILHFFLKLDKLKIFSYFLDKYNYTIDSDDFLNSKKTIFYFLGYWQNIDYLNKTKHGIIQYLSNNPLLKESLNSINDQKTAMIHVRRGDFLKDRRELKAEYYIKSINIMKQNDIEIFDVFTDDEDWVKDQSFFKDVRNIYTQKSGKDDEYRSRGINSLDDREETIKTFAQMLSYNHFVVGNSSFAFWAAYLKSKEESLVTIANPLFRNEKRNHNNDKRGKLYLDNWYLIENI